MKAESHLLFVTGKFLICCHLSIKMACTYKLYEDRDKIYDCPNGANVDICRKCKAKSQRLQIEKSLSLGNISGRNEGMQEMRTFQYSTTQTVASLCRNKLNLYRAEKELDLSRSKSSRSSSEDSYSKETYNFSIAHEKELKNLAAQLAELQRQREAALREVAELKVQLKMAEETRDTIRRDLIEANRKIREGKFPI